MKLNTDASLYVKDLLTEVSYALFGTPGRQRNGWLYLIIGALVVLYAL